MHDNNLYASRERVPTRTRARRPISIIKYVQTKAEVKGIQTFTKSHKMVSFEV